MKFRREQNWAHKLNRPAYYMLVNYLVCSECRFGGERYELEETWHPDLGPPFGVMFCVHCECVPVSTNALLKSVCCKKNNFLELR